MSADSSCHMMSQGSRRTSVRCSRIKSEVCRLKQSIRCRRKLCVSARRFSTVGSGSRSPGVCNHHEKLLCSPIQGLCSMQRSKCLTLHRFHLRCFFHSLPQRQFVEAAGGQ
ncbi:hypothetical protein GN956_G1666 [Arapaima gigas]